MGSHRAQTLKDEPMAGRVQDKVIVVAGAGSVGPGWGNGQASAALYARQGAIVYLIDRMADAVAENRRVIEAEDGRCHAATGDLTDGDTAKSLLGARGARFGRPDVIHNNVGGAVPGGDAALDER